MHWIKNEAPDLHFEDDWAWVYSNSSSSLYQSVDGWLLHQMKSIQLHREEERRGGVSNICQHCSCRCQYSVWWLVSSRLKLNWVVLGPRWLVALPGSPVTNMSYLTMQPLAQNFIQNVSRSITALWLSLLPAWADLQVVWERNTDSGPWLRSCLRMWQTVCHCPTLPRNVLYSDLSTDGNSALPCLPDAGKVWYLRDIATAI